MSLSLLEKRNFCVHFGSSSFLNLNLGFSLESSKHIEKVFQSLDKRNKNYRIKQLEFLNDFISLMSEHFKKNLVFLHKKTASFPLDLNCLPPLRSLHSGEFFFEESKKLIT